MTRAKPGSTRSRSWEDRDRRSMYLNIGFGLTIVVAILLLVIAWGASWYGDHLAQAGSVSGETITKDAFAKQVDINAFRADYQSRRIRTLLAAGRIRAADAEARQAVIDQRLGQTATISLEQLVDGTIQAKLAPDQGVTVTDADIDARFAEEATTPELRHAWMIAVAPELAAGESAPTDAAKAAAKAKAAAALADLKAGKDWETVAKAVSTDATKDQAGDLSFVDKFSTLDQPFLDAVMAAAQDTPTEVIEGLDGTYRVGRVTEIVAPVVDATLESQVKDAGISLDDFRAALRREVVRSKLDDAIVAARLAPGPQREVSEILIQEGQSESGPQAVRTRHILYSPNDDPQNASTLPADDPGWAAAEAAAKATYEKLKADPSLFDSIARAESDESAAVSTGGKLPYFSADDPIDPAFWKAISAPGLQPGQLLAPVKSSFGWHVIQVQHFPTDQEWAAKLKTQMDAGTLPFADAARDNSDKASAADGGLLGWVGKGQLDEAQEAAIFAAPIGKVSDPLTVPGEGIYLYKVSTEETRAPEGDQAATLKNSAFSIWYAKQKATFDIVRDAAIAGDAAS
jgi:parvulin-like peptidyl-prolyl isomerase